MGNRNFTAGRRKCYRCKVVYNRERAAETRLCPDCLGRCHRCNVMLTVENTPPNQRKGSFRCKDCRNEIASVSGLKDGGFRRRDTALVRKYGITAVEYGAILKAQNGVCYICQKPPKEGGNRLAVDHLHSKGENKRNPIEKRIMVRGLLCWPCNKGLAVYKDDITRFKRAVSYLEQWPAQSILKEKK